VDTVITAGGLSVLFGEDKIAEGLEAAWADLEGYLGKGFSALFYGATRFLPVYAAAGDNLQFGRLWHNGTVS
jgi:hypothetical protein